MHSEIQSIKAQPLAMQKQLLKIRDETKAAQEEVKAVKTQAVIEIEEIKKGKQLNNWHSINLGQRDLAQIMIQ